MGSPIDIAALPRENLRGSLYMVLAMAAFALEDMFVKTAASTLPTSEVLLLFGTGGLLVFGIMALLRGERLFSAEAVSPIMRLRFVFETLARLFYVLALALSPLSAATAILQATPIFVAMGAAAFFREKVGWSRWAAIILGLSGVLIVLRPAADGFSTLSILALLGMLGFAARDLASRASPASLGSAVLGFYGYLAIIVAGIAYLPLEGRPLVMPNTTSGITLIAAVAFGTTAYIALMKAMRTGELSVVTPFRYTRLLFGLALGIVAFGEGLDLATIAGSIIVVLAGLLTLRTGRPKRSPLS